MLSIRGVYDGSEIKPLEPIPFKDEVEVIITFIKDGHRKSGQNWRELRGSAKGENLLDSLIDERRKDLKRGS